MIMDLLYDHSLLFTGVLVIGVFIAVALLGLWVTRQLVPLAHRRSHNDVLGFMAGAVGVLYAVLLAFIAVAVWESFNKAGDIASHEASLAGDLYRDIGALPHDARKSIAIPLQEYVRVVIEDEWPAMAKGETPGRAGWELLEQVHDQLGQIQNPTAIQVVVVQEMFSRLNSLYDSRRDRLDAATDDSLHPSVWAVVLLGGTITLSFCWLFGFESVKLHFISTGLVAACLGLVIFLIIGFDYPFRGKIQIAPSGFEQVRVNMGHLTKMLE